MMIEYTYDEFGSSTVVPKSGWKEIKRNKDWFLYHNPHHVMWAICTYGKEPLYVFDNEAEAKAMFNLF